MFCLDSEGGGFPWFFFTKRPRNGRSGLRPVTKKPVGRIFKISDSDPTRGKCRKCGRSLSGGILWVISNYRYRIVLPEEVISIAETDLWECQQKISHCRHRFSLEPKQFPSQIQIMGLKRMNSVKYFGYNPVPNILTDESGESA